MYLHGWQCSEIKLYVPHRRLTEKQPKRFEETLQSGFINTLNEEEKTEKIDIADMHLTMDYNIASDSYERPWDETRVQEWAYKTIETLFEELDFVINKGHNA